MSKQKKPCKGFFYHNDSKVTVFSSDFIASLFICWHAISSIHDQIIRMRISVIGAGRVAYHLSKVFREKHELVQVFSRNKEKSCAWVQALGAELIDDYALINGTVDLIVIAVSDQSISRVIQNLNEYAPNTLIVHTSGSTHLDVLHSVHVRAGVFYPLQTFSLEREIDWQNTPLFVEASSSTDLSVLMKLAESISSHVYAYTSEQRLSLHLAAVFACNFSNYCYDMAKQILDNAHVDFHLLKPLILETAQKAVQNDPQNMQTGPAMRGDQNILGMHKNMLSGMDRAEFSEIYQLFSQQILERHQK